MTTPDGPGDERPGREPADDHGRTPTPSDGPDGGAAGPGAPPPPGPADDLGREVRGGWDATVRRHTYPCPGPAVLDLRLDAGQITVALAADREDADREDADRGHIGGAADPAGVRVRIEADLDAAPAWVKGLSGLLSWLDGSAGTDPAVRAADAVAATTVDWDPDARTLHVVSPRDRSLRGVPLVVTLAAPDRTSLRVRAGAAAVEVTGRAEDVSVSGTGAVTLEEVAGRTELRCGAGEIHIGRVHGRARLVGGAGGITVDHLSGPTEITTGAGRVRLGEVGADTAVRAGAGDVEVRDARAGDLDLHTGVGSLRVGVHAGVDARVDLRAATGRARSELPVDDHAPAGRAAGAAGDTRPLRIRGRTAAGEAVVGRAAV